MESLEAAALICLMNEPPPIILPHAAGGPFISPAYDDAIDDVPLSQLLTATNPDSSLVAA